MSAVLRLRPAARIIQLPSSNPLVRHHDLGLTSKDNFFPVVVVSFLVSWGFQMSSYQHRLLALPPRGLTASSTASSIFMKQMPDCFRDRRSGPAAAPTACLPVSVFPPLSRSNLGNFALRMLTEISTALTTL